PSGPERRTEAGTRRRARAGGSPGAWLEGIGVGRGIVCCAESKRTERRWRTPLEWFAAGGGPVHRPDPKRAQLARCVGTSRLLLSKHAATLLCETPQHSRSGNVALGHPATSPPPP